MTFNWFKKKEKQLQKTSDATVSKSDEIVSPTENDTTSIAKAKPQSSADASDQPTTTTQQINKVVDTPPAADKADENSHAAPPKPNQSKGFFGRLKQGLSKTRDILTTVIEEIFTVSTLRDIIHRESERIALLDIFDPGITVDIDTPEDFQMASEHLASVIR